MSGIPRPITHSQTQQGLGWNWLTPNEKNDTYFYPISHEQLPFLSAEEILLVKTILEQFYTKNEWQRNPNDLQALLQHYCTENNIFLDEEQQEYIFKTLRLHAWEFGPLSILLRDPAIEEITIAGIGKDFPVRVYIAGEGWKTTPICFTHAPSLITLLNRMALDSGKRLSSANPTLNARMSDGSRLHASIEPICVHQVEATIRKFIFRPQTPEQLLVSNVISAEALAFLILSMRVDCNVLIAGNTGSGKTTTLNALLGTLSPQERFVLVEETPELQLAQPHVVRLTPSIGAKIELAELIRETLRMRPDRMVIGEMRSPEEAKAWMESVLSGQGKGTYATFHGHSATEAIARLRQFGILEQDLAWTNLIVTQRRWTQHFPKQKSNEIRAVCEITEINLDKNNNVQLRKLFEWNEKMQLLQCKEKSVVVKEKFSWCYPTKKFENELKSIHAKLKQSQLS